MKIPFDYENATESERKAFSAWAFENSPLDKEEQWIEDHRNEFVPVENQEDVRNHLNRSGKKSAENTLFRQGSKKARFIALGLNGHRQTQNHSR